MKATGNAMEGSNNFITVTFPLPFGMAINPGRKCSPASSTSRSNHLLRLQSLGFRCKVSGSAPLCAALIPQREDSHHSVKSRKTA